MGTNKWKSIKEEFPDIGVKVLVMSRVAKEVGNGRIIVAAKLTNDGFKDLSGKWVDGEVIKWSYI
jgi:hypothetical protein